MNHLVTAFLAIIGFLFAMFGSFRQGKKSQEATYLKEMIKQNEEKQKVDNFVDGLNRDDLDDLVREYKKKD